MKIESARNGKSWDEMESNSDQVIVNCFIAWHTDAYVATFSY